MAARKSYGELREAQRMSLPRKVADEAMDDVFNAVNLATKASCVADDIGDAIDYLIELAAEHGIDEAFGVAMNLQDTLAKQVSVVAELNHRALHAAGAHAASFTAEGARLDDELQAKLARKSRPVTLAA